jgi:hypothetical protein
MPRGFALKLAVFTSLIIGVAALPALSATAADKTTD